MLVARCISSSLSSRHRSTSPTGLILTGDNLKLFPSRGRLRRAARTRELTVIRPYVLVHRIAAESVVILRLPRTARRIVDRKTVCPFW